MLDVWLGLFGVDYQRMRSSWVTWLTYWTLWSWWLGTGDGGCVQKVQSDLTNCTHDDYPDWVMAL